MVSEQSRILTLHSTFGKSPKKRKTRLCIKVGRGQGDGDIGTRGDLGPGDIKHGTRGRMGRGRGRGRQI